MTDLTPEQVERWADDETPAARQHLWHVNRIINYTRARRTVRLDDAAHLHAHAKILQQQATIERLTALIDEHNRRCSQHPLDRAYMIDTQDGVK